LSLYKRYLGDYASGLPATGLLFPLQMLDENHAATGLIRTIMSIDEAEGSLILAGDVKQDGYLRLMQASTENLVDGAEAAGTQVRQRLPGDSAPGLAILVSCVGRRLVMGDRVEEEVEAVTEHLGDDTLSCGFYSYGEISPFTTTTDCKLHNQTMTVTFLGER